MGVRLYFTHYNTNTVYDVLYVYAVLEYKWFFSKNTIYNITMQTNGAPWAAEFHRALHVKTPSCHDHTRPLHDLDS